MIKCSKGHEVRIIAVRTERETVDDIGYTKERIKHFDREGSEFWAEIDVPVIVEKVHEVEVTEYTCPTCGESRTVRRPKAVDGPGA